MSTTANTKRILWTILAVGLVGIGIFALNDWLRSQEPTAPTHQLPNYGSVPNFTLTTQDNRSLSLADLKGKIWLTDLIFTHCAGTCPMLSARMASLQSALDRAGRDVQLVSFSCDPHNDTPAALREYAKKYGADPQRWTFLTGSVGTIYHVARDGFHLAIDSANANAEQPIVHSERLVLVDRNGAIRGYYDGTSADAQSKVLADIGDLMREGKPE